jgi:hypothetical protein
VAVASLELRKNTYRVVFLYRNRKYGFSLDTGDRTTVLTRLAEVVKKMQAARANPPGEGAIHAWWDEVRKGLEEWLTAPGGAREGFWK